MLCLICARSGSKGLKNKNILKINDKSLLQITIEKAKQIKEIKHIVLSTDSTNIANLGAKYGAKILFLRPKRLSQDNSPEWKVWQHAIEKCEKSISFIDVIVLPVVSPLRKVSDIKKTIFAYYKNKRKKGVITATESKRSPYFNMIKIDENKTPRLLIKKKNFFYRRQDVPKVYDMCTISYVMPKNMIKRKKSLFDCQLIVELIPKSRSIDIDDKYDYEIAKYLYGKKL
jgi:CMP-N-acetylneuraminic acid synthetase